MRVRLHQGAFATKFHAADAAHFDLILQAGVRNGFVKLLFDAFGAAGQAAGGHAAAKRDLFPSRQFRVLDLDKIVENHAASHFWICPTAAVAVCRGVTAPS